MKHHPAVVAALGGYEPTEEQWRAIEHPLGPVAVIAGAGSGKTAVMAARLANIVVSGAARPSQILGLTFTNKAAQELDERIRRATEHVDVQSGEEVGVYTYHGFADRILRDYGPKIGIEPEVALMSEAQAFMLVARLFEEITFERLRVTHLPSLIAKVRALAEACSNHLVDPAEVIAADRALERRYLEMDKKIPAKLKRTLNDRPEIARVVEAYVDKKRELARIDFGDQIRFAYRVVTERPEVANALRTRWPVVLLDEYQDTNIAQREMMRAIYPEGSSITVVGDPDQAIYAWRGATLYNILRFPQHFKSNAGGAAMLPLQRSFRSGRRILEAADALIGAVPADRRGGEKVLEHHPPTGEGDVRCDLLESDADEATLLAAEIKDLTTNGGGPDGTKVPCGEIAVLCRKRRLFGGIHEALRREGIPVEVVGLGGLLTVPEVVDLLACLRMVANPADNISFARIAMGPRWRIHFRDMAVLARWAAERTHEFRTALTERDASEEEVDPGEERFSLSEALVHLDEIEGLSDAARQRLARIREEIESLRAAARGATLAEAIEQVLTDTGIEDELRAAGTPTAAAALANLGSFIDRANSFAPLEGEASIPAFLEYLEAAESVEDLEAAQPQLDDSVKLMTVHQAKGLEFDVVFIPGAAKDIFPDAKVTDNPLQSSSELPFSVRDDRDELPEFDIGVPLTKFQEALKDRAMEDERRLAYVALTRARKRLHVTAAHWYTAERERKTPNGPGRFFEELAGWPASDERESRGPLPSVSVGTYAECPEENPLRGELARRAQAWPGESDVRADDVFPEGARVMVERLREDESEMDVVDAGHDIDRSDVDRAREPIAQQLQIVTAPPSPPAVDDRLTSLSVSSLVQLARCPKQFYWTVVRPLPRRPSSNARRGHEIHRWIEIESMGQQRLGDPEDPPDLSPEELAERAEGIARVGPTDADLKRSFKESRFAVMRPRSVEQPFVIALQGGYLVRGRIDAIFEHDDGSWEIVDYKTGREPDAADDTARLQLGVYALAAQKIWGVDPSQLRVTYFYLATGRADTVEATELTTDEATIGRMFERVEGQELDPTPGSMCHYCDFLRFCKEGQEFTQAAAAR
jgi:DNA helicase-2/ATP-dependent DNA helicase PcrA